MSLQLRISLIVILSICSSFTARSQQNDSLKRIHSPYRTEHNPWYTLGKFKRGFSEDSIKVVLDQLENKPRKEWTRLDSLNFAKSSLNTGNIELSQYYFDHVKPKPGAEEDFWWDQLTIAYLKGNYDEGISLITRDHPGIMEFSTYAFMLRILEAKKNEEAKDKWYRQNKVLNWSVDSSRLKMDRKSEEYDHAIIQPLKNLEFVLKKLIRHIHDDDEIIARACFEMGLILESYVSLSQGYIGMSLGRHYNKWDREILDNVRRVKAKMNEKKLKIPVFRKYFPRIEYWRFDYEVLKEKVVQAKRDTLDKKVPHIMNEPEDRSLISFPAEWIVIGGIILLIIVVAVILKIK